MAYFLSVFFGGTLTGIFLDGSGLSGALLFSLFGAGCLAALLAARTGLAWWATRQRNKVKQLMHRLIDSMSESATKENQIEPVIEHLDLGDGREGQAAPTQHKHKIGMGRSK